MKTVIEMAREAGFRVGPAGMGQTVWGSDEDLERFAALVAAAEREAIIRLLNTRYVFTTPHVAQAAIAKAQGESK